MSDGEIILYRSEDGQTEIQLRPVDYGTVWLTQAQMSDLFDTSKQNISLHLNNVISDGELGACARFSCQGILDTCHGWEGLPHEHL